MRVYTKRDNFRKQEFAKLTAEQRIKLRIATNAIPQHAAITLPKLKCLEKPLPDEGGGQ
jgi:hypothetical protein